MASAGVPDSPHDVSLIYMVGRVNQGIRRAMTERLARWDLSVTEYTTLSVLHARPNLSNAQLARRALVTPQSMIEIVARLQAQGLVTRTVDPGHRRILRLRLTDAGEEVRGAADPAIAALDDELFAGVPARQRQAAADAMRAAMVHLSKAAAADRPRA
jgi:DNA-binding MarR family transcriptional regulator